MIIAPSLLQVKALAYVLLAYLLAGGMLYMGFRQFFYVRWTIICGLITAVAFLTGSSLFALVMIMLVLWYPRVKMPIDRLSAYLILLPLFPVTWGVVVPGVFPGMNFLMVLNHPVSMSVMALLPMFVIYLSHGSGQFEISRSVKFLDALVIVFFILMMGYSFRDPTFTSGLRSMVMQFLSFFLPYFIFSRCITKLDDFFYVFRALILAILILAWVGVFSELFHWNFYGILKDFMLYGIYSGQFSDIRGGMLRVNGTIIYPIGFGYVMVIGMFALLMLFQWYKPKKIFISFTAFVVLIALVFSVSRGAWLSCLVFMGLLYFLPKKKFGVSGFLIMFIVVGSFLVIWALGMNPAQDEYGTFDFRARLIALSIQVMGLHPWFGVVAPMDNPVFDELRRGDGLVDIVNTYLGVALTYGIPVLMIFCLILLSVFILLLLRTRAVVRVNSEEALKLSYIGAGLTAMIASTVVLLGTVSSVSYIPIYYWILIGLSVSYLKVTGCLKKANVSQ